MKPFVYTAAIGFLLTASMTTVQATGVFKEANAPHLTTSSALPSNARAPFANYRFGIHVIGYSLAELSIDIPEGVKVGGGITITDQFGKKLEANTAIEGKTVMIVFAQPVAPETILRIRLNSVRTSTLESRVWLFPISMKSPEILTDIPLGIVRIDTYD